MKSRLFLLCLLFAAGCARTWQFAPIDDFRPSAPVPASRACQSCHPSQFDSWKRTRHASPEHMALIPLQDLRECGACHPQAGSHAADVSVKPGTSPRSMNKSEQNTLCGKCHFNQQIFGSAAINPDDKHALFMDVGFEGKKRQISCLDCHSGHQGGAAMLVSIKAHICFTCHKEAIVTMGVFQPLNYLFFGKACQGCHAVHGGSAGAQAARMGAGVCVVCHFVGTALVGD